MNFHIKESQFLYWTILLDRFAKIKATYMTWPNQKNANWPRLLNVCYKLINDAMLYGRFPLYLIKFRLKNALIDEKKSLLCPLGGLTVVIHWRYTW